MARIKLLRFLNSRLTSFGICSSRKFLVSTNILKFLQCCRILRADNILLRLVFDSPRCVRDFKFLKLLGSSPLRLLRARLSDFNPLQEKRLLGIGPWNKFEPRFKETRFFIAEQLRLIGPLREFLFKYNLWSDGEFTKEVGKWPVNKFDMAENCSILASLIKMSGRTPENKVEEISSLIRLERLPIPLLSDPDMLLP